MSATRKLETASDVAREISRLVEAFDDEYGADVTTTNINDVGTSAVREKVEFEIECTDRGEAAEQRGFTITVEAW